MFEALFQPTDLIVTAMLVVIYWLIVSGVRRVWRGRETR